MKILSWLIRILCAVVLIGLFVWIVDHNVSFGGYKKIDYMFGDPGPVVSELQPVSRLGSKEYGVDGTSFQKMFEDPVYFDLITPVTYRRARLTLIFDSHTSIPLRMGVHGVGDDYVLYDMGQDYTKEGWTVGHVDIDLSSAGWERGKYRFVVSVPGLIRGNSDEYVSLSSVEVELYKDPITFASMKSVIQRIIRAVLK